MKKTWKLTGPESLENKTLLSVVPNDSRVNEQWSLKSMSAYQAWTYNTGSKDVVVAIIDSGIDLTNKDLKNNIWTNPGEIAGDGIDNENNGYVDDVHGWNFNNNTNNVQDGYGHGTHIAGIIGAEGNNGVGVAGINWHVSLMALKFFDDKGVGWTSGALSAMDYILMMRNTYHINIVVANVSWGGGIGFSNTLYNKISQLNDSGILLTAAAGNNGSDNDITARYPSCFDIDNVISVGALGYTGTYLASYSNYGATSVDLAAPGGAILSTIPWNNYGYMSGTSMAAPQVAGAVALLNAVKPGISINEVKNAIFSSVDKIPELFGKVATNGKLNVAAAVCGVLGIQYDSNNYPTGAITNQTLRRISGWVTDPDSPNAVLSVRLNINGTDVKEIFSGTGGSFIFNLDMLRVGSHVISVSAKDIQNGSWTVVAKTTVTIPPPVVRVGYLTLDRIAGWAFSQRSGAAPVVVRILINDKLVAGQWANQYRPALRYTLGSMYHGYNIPLSRLWFHKGSNNIKIQVYDPISKQVSVVWSGNINK